MADKLIPKVKNVLIYLQNVIIVELLDIFPLFVPDKLDQNQDLALISFQELTQLLGIKLIKQMSLITLLQLMVQSLPQSKLCHFKIAIGFYIMM